MAFLSGSNNGNFVAQGAQNLQQPFTSGQITNAQDQAQGGIGQQQALVNALNAQNGLQNQSNVYGQLQNVIAGQGPNPAQAMLNQATGQNVANQAALAAGQRGASANVGLLQRQSAMQGANAQQQAVGQGATLQAQQGLSALGQAGGLANNQVANQMAGIQGLNSAIQGNQGQLISGLGAQNQANISNAAQQNQANEGIAASNNQAEQGLIGGLINATGGVAAAALAHGGQVENSKLAQVPESDRFPGHMMLPSHLQDVATIYHGNKFKPMKQGGMVPGQAKQSGDHFSNDTVPAKLSPGEMVLPKSVMESKDPVKEAAKFVASHLKKKGKGDVKGDFKAALSDAIKNRKSK